MTLKIGALALLVFCGGATAARPAWQEGLERAERLSKEGKNAQAVKEASGVLADAEKSAGPEAPEIGRILARLSRIYETAGDAPRLAEMEKRLTSVKAKGFEVWLALGMLLRSEEKLLEAEGALMKALVFKPDDFEAGRELAIVYQDMGRDEEAVRLFEAAINKNPRDRVLYFKLGRSDMILGRRARAKEAFLQAKKLEGKSIDAYVHEGYFNLDVGEHAQAEQAFEAAIAVDTSSPLGYHHMGSYLAAHRRYPEAERYFRRALKMLEADPRTRTVDLLHTVGWLGDVLLKQRRPAEAEVVLRGCLEKAEPNAVSIRCLLTLGSAYASQDKNAQAEEALKRAATVCEGGPSCTCHGLGLIGLGEFYLKQGRKREAAAIAEQAGKLCAAHRETNPFVLLDLAGLYAGLGDVSKGESLYSRVLTAGRSMPFDSALPTAQRRMADLEMAQGRFHEAEDLYRQAIQVLKNHGDGQQEAVVLDGLAAACEKEGKPREAAEAREKARALKALGRSSGLASE